MPADGPAPTAEIDITPQQEATGTVPLRRPPIRRSTVVRSDGAHTFDVFVRTIGTWWPVRPYSSGQDKVRQVTFEERPGGRLFETWDDGASVEWGKVLSWDPPSGFTISWRNTPAVTEVEVTFREIAPGLTRVSVEHRGWEGLTSEQLGEDCAEPGGYLGGAYATGWAAILSSFTEAVEADADGKERVR